MHPEQYLAALSLVALVTVGCGDDAHTDDPKGAGGEGAGGGQGAGAPTDIEPVSSKATVKFKGLRRITADLARGLDLDETQLCFEIDGTSCAQVHAVTLGGTDAYDAGVYTALAETAVTTPMAVDRITLAACTKRVDDDLAGVKTTLLSGVDLQGDQFADVDGAATQVITQLYHRALQREPKPAELEHLRGLYDTVAADGQPGVARDWTVLSCYAVFTTMESLFY